jgi:hypothetical protein
MAIDGVVVQVKKKSDGDVLVRLVPRKLESGRLSVVGQERLLIVRPYEVPRNGTRVWGDAGQVFVGGRRYKRKSYNRLVRT